MRLNLERRQSKVNGTWRFGRLYKDWLILSLIVGFGIAGCPRGAFAENAPEVMVRVVNYAQVPSSSVRAAELEAGRIFLAAGLLTHWVNCPGKDIAPETLNPCCQPLASHEIVLRLISEPTSEAYRDSVFGFAVVPLVASVYVNYVVRSAKRDNAEFEVPVILGNVIAHEIGHLLLGHDSHSDTGIMQKHWERKQMQLVIAGNLLFTRAQAELLQAEMQRRIRVRTAAI